MSAITADDMRATINEWAVGTADDLGETLTRQPEQWVSEISGVRLMARSKKGLDLAQEAMALQREVQSQGFTIHPRP